MPEIRLAGSRSPLFTLPDLEIDEFVPVVKIDSAKFESDKLAALLKGDKIELSSHIDEPLRTIEMDIVVAVPGEMVVTCTVAKGRNASLDDDGIITPRLVGKVQGVTVKAIEEGKARYGEAYQFSVEIVGSGARNFQVELFANDDAQDANSGEFKDVLCGRIEVRTWPDVFSKSDADRLTDEMEFIGVFAPYRTPNEYAGMYCMKAAERGLSELLENKIDFYSVNKNHEIENAIDFTDKGAKDRGDAFKKNGFISDSFEYDEYVIDHKIRTATTDELEYEANKHSVVSLPGGSKLCMHIRESVRQKPGFHVFYLSVTDDTHTLLLVIDNRSPSSKRYEIYDQGGQTTSRGPLVDLETGLERQTSWVFLFTYMEDGFNPRDYPATKTRIWKIQRKH